ncbi:hypothetical protein [Nonomuraea jabiensis]|uniref:Uncharacterized protein n=1 Tax=Nonomuraea jabiensis TaxID=882448 RepID=A0A7W9LGX4_9ACTN|nr:hypothetical protein [Nonomuraea jabiensis]MBB5783389.1 hypothetical protein [Nonomuraea jabiensis]
MRMIKIAVAVLAVAALFFTPAYGYAAVDLTMCKIRVAQQHPLLAQDVTPLLARLFPADSVTAIDRADNCEFEPDPDLTPSPSASVVVTVAGVQHVRDALAMMHREGWRFGEPFEEIDPFGQIPELTKEFSHGTVDAVVEVMSDGAPVSGGSGVTTWEFEFSYS